MRGLVVVVVAALLSAEAAVAFRPGGRSPAVRGGGRALQRRAIDGGAAVQRSLLAPATKKRRAVARSASSEDEDEDDEEEEDGEAELFMARVALVEALRGVEMGGGAGGEDLVTLKKVAALQIEASYVRVDLADGVDPAVKQRCEEAVQAAVRALKVDGMLKEDCVAVVVSNDDFSSLGGVKKVVAVSSCKGGVGKSTVCVNLALALKKKGFKVGIADIDVHGPSLRILVGPAEDETIRLADRVDRNGRELLEPFSARGLKLMSFAYLSGDTAPMRGSRVAGVVEQLTTSVAWRDLDFLLVDMPPGTGDAQLTLTQNVPLDAAVVVTTPTKLSFADVVKGIDFFDTVDVPVLAVVENMASFRPLDLDKARSKARAFFDRHHLTAENAAVDDLAALLAAPQAIFGAGHARKLRDMWGIPNAARIALVPSMAQRPLYDENDDEKNDDQNVLEARRSFDELADALVNDLLTGDARRDKPQVSYEAGALVADHLGARFLLDPKTLRDACRCAACVDETTGQRTAKPTSGPVHPTRLAPNGNYALAVDWSDGHRSLYPYRAFVPNYAAKQQRASSAPEDAARQPQPLDDQVPAS